jgi:hypothetical protein
MSGLAGAGYGSIPAFILGVMFSGFIGHSSPCASLDCTEERKLRRQPRRSRHRGDVVTMEGA